MKAFIFRCNSKTKDEVFERMLFGEERDYLQLVKSITPADLLFLYNTSTYEFSGPYKPVSEGGEYLVKGAWQDKFPSQIKFELLPETKTIPFSRIEKIITRYKKGIFPYMELDEGQVEKIQNAES
ncbi:MAG TPA: hypothetical protein PKU78_04220 [Candidatus Dojkabacteria bacterium]|nr:hypothetical protein [Candidatus Dojkabacteria bacterium]HRO65399.1 hypothetical protein [Candidatus Dojkabacteria bacterium]HRP51308.1 hypothetical protein [Candidatus Dojkabacteria bacterium]